MMPGWLILVGEILALGAYWRYLGWRARIGDD